MTPYEEIVTLTQQAQQAIAAQNYNSALSSYGQSLKLAQSINRPQLIAVLFNRRGKVLETQGEVQQAVIAYESALQSLEPGASDKVDRMISRLSQVGKGFYTSPEPVPDLYSPQATERLTAAEADPALEIKLWIDVGNAYFRQPQENPALNAYQQALADKQIDQYPLLKAYAKANAGEIFRRQNNLGQAVAHLTEALSLFETEGELLKSRRALALLAGIVRDGGDAPKADSTQIPRAIALYQQAIDLYEQAQDTKGHARTLAGLARLYLTQQDFAAAEPLYGEARELATSLRDEETLWHVLWGLGCCRYQASDMLEAIDYFTGSIRLIDRRQDSLQTDEGKVTFLDSVKDVFDQLLLAWLTLAQDTVSITEKASAYASALAVAEQARGRALQDMMGGRSYRRPAEWRQENAPFSSSVQAPESSSDLKLLTLANSEWAQALNLDPSVSGSPMEHSPMEQRSPAMSIMEQRAAATPTFPEGSPIDADIDARPLVDAPPLARLVFYVLLDRTAVFAISAGGQVTGYVAPIGCHALEERVAQLRHTLEVDEAGRGLTRKAIAIADLVTPTATTLPLETQLQSLYADLIEPVAEGLPPEGVPLVIEPHNVLWLVPFAALKITKDTWMSERWPLLYAPSLATLEEIRQEPPYAPIEESKAVIVGNPVMPTSSGQTEIPLTLGALPGAEKEAKAIHDVLGQAECQIESTLLLGSEATESLVKELSQTHNLLHLATHGVAYTADPLASFVAFSPTAEDNGLLTAREVADNRALPLDLVVLSACQTALGKISGDGMLGLSRAFLIAGARTVVVSQWSVDDAATAALMVEFYRAYSQHGQKAIALQTAMASVRSHPDYRHPRYWSAFMVVGAEA